MRKIIIRSDAGSQIGSGHVARQMRVAEEFKRQGCEITWAVSEETLNAKPDVANWNHIALPDLPEAEQIDFMFANLSSDDARPHIIIDGFNIGEDTVTRLRHSDRCDSITFMDEKLNRPLGCIDILIDIFPHKMGAVRDRNIVSDKTEILIGPDYSPMPESVIALRSMEKKISSQSPKNVLLMNGGLNLGGLLQGLSSVLSDNSQLFNDVQFTAFMLSNNQTQTAAKNTEQAFEVARQKGLNVNLRCNASQDNIHGQMASADLYIGSASSTSIYEISALGGCAFIGIGAGHTQDEMADIIAKRGMGFNAGQYMSLDNGVTDLNYEFNWQNLVEKAHHLLSDDVQRQKMHDASASFCDGYGASRVVKAVLEVL